MRGTVIVKKPMTKHFSFCIKKEAYKLQMNYVTVNIILKIKTI